MKEAVRRYLLALQFFTRLPVTGQLAAWVEYSPERLRASAAHFPGIGWLVGAVAALVWYLVASWLGGHASTMAAGWVAAVVSTIATVLLTGAFHEDGLADVADGLGGSPDRERALAIMKDSRLGAFGVLALILVLVLKFSLLVTLAQRGDQLALLALCSAHVLSRLAPLFLIRTMTYVGGGAAEGGTESSKAKPLADAISGSALATGVAWSLPAVATLVAAAGLATSLVCLLAMLLVTVCLGRWFRRRLGGFTGDCLGATQQLTEVTCYLALAGG